LDTIADIEKAKIDKALLEISFVDEYPDSVRPNFIFNVLRDSLTAEEDHQLDDNYDSDDSYDSDENAYESLTTIMSGLEELQESTLETYISNSLVEAYGNVAGFRLTECAYSNNKFTVDGTIYFTSGRTRKTTYTFAEGHKAPKGKISLRGLNEKLGLDKQFTITGRIDNKTLITESFKRSK
jgi:hypothetical protein